MKLNKLNTAGAWHEKYAFKIEESSEACLCSEYFPHLALAAASLHWPALQVTLKGQPHKVIGEGKRDPFTQVAGKTLT